MSVLMQIRNPIFRAQDLYKMLRLSLIKYFPYDTYNIGTDEILTIFFQKEIAADFSVENIESERGLTFSGKTYEIFKDIVKEEEVPDHSTAWYVSQVAKWHKQDLGFLRDDLNMMRIWLEANDFIKKDLPTEKFLKEEFLVIADTAEEKRRAG